MENQLKQRKRSDGVTVIIFLAIFLLALSSLIVSIRLIQQKTGGIGSLSLLLFSVLGIAGGIFGILSSHKQSEGALSTTSSQTAVTLELEQKNVAENSKAVKHLEQLVGMLEEQVKTLQEEKSSLQKRNVELRGDIKVREDTITDWQNRSLDVFRMIDRVVNSEMAVDPIYKEAMVRMKNHFSQLVAPLGIIVVEPEQNTPFDEKQHHAVSEDKNSNLEPWRVVKCLEWGYSINGEVIVPAKVVVSRTR